MATLEPRSSLKVTVKIVPKEASVIVASALLNVPDEGESIIKLSAIGKFPYLKVSSKKLHFGDLLYGKRVTKKLLIKNVSEVDTIFKIQKLVDDDFEDSSFSLDTYEGTIQSK